MGKYLTQVKLLPRVERRLLRGHRWIYKTDIDDLPELEDGALVDVYSYTDKFVCRAFYQKEGNIFGRIISYHQEEIDENFFKNLLDSALKLRKKIFPNSNVFRWLYAESDSTPGLIIDRYQNLAVAESNLKFYELKKDSLVQALLSFQGVDNVITNFPSKQRDSSELPENIKIELNGLNLIVPVRNSQKTGLFLDQRMNYLYSQKYMSNAEVLDCFSYVGVWSCHALKANAKSVVLVESSEKAVEVAKENLKLNKYEIKSEVVKGDVENVLKDTKKYDVIILDPPAYIKKKEDYQKGFAKYINLNAMAIKNLNKGGFLITCSCSHFISQIDFREIIKRALRKESRRAKLLEFHGASPDHPEHLMMPELSYLKCAILQVI